MHTETVSSALVQNLRRENRRLHAENERLHAENERLHAALAREATNANLHWYSSHEMTAGTSLGSRHRR